MEGAYKDCPEGDLVRVYEGMDLFDDDLMSMVFDGNIPATEFLLKIILKRDDIIVISAVSQREFKKYLQSGDHLTPRTGRSFSSYPFFSPKVVDLLVAKNI